MINKIISAIADDIKSKFGNIKIYTEKVKQGYESPCFSIICKRADSGIYRGSRYRMTAEIEIHYYNNKQRENCNDTMLSLFDIINYVNLDGFPIRACQMSMETDSDCCIFKAGYDFFYYTENNEEKELMGEYKDKIKIG